MYRALLSICGIASTLSASGTPGVAASCSAPDPVPGELVTGTAIIDMISDTARGETLVVVIVDRNTDRDSVADGVYVFETAGATTDIPRGRYSGVAVKYTPQSVVIDGVEDPGPLVLSLDESRNGRGRRIHGFGLSRRTGLIGHWKLVGESLTPSQYLRLLLECSLPSDEDECDGGGAGAAYCSISGCSGDPSECSVTCMATDGDACCWCQSRACCRCGYVVQN